MKRGVFSFFIVAFLSGFVAEQNDADRPVKNDSFKRAEVSNVKMTYGFITVGKASVNIHPKYFRINNRDCFKVDVYGKPVGLVDWVADVDDRWGAYIDTVALVPHQFYRRIR